MIKFACYDVTVPLLQLLRPSSLPSQSFSELHFDIEQKFKMSTFPLWRAFVNTGVEHVYYFDARKIYIHLTSTNRPLTIDVGQLDQLLWRTDLQTCTDVWADFCVTKLDLDDNKAYRTAIPARGENYLSSKDGWKHCFIQNDVAFRQGSSSRRFHILNCLQVWKLYVCKAFRDFVFYLDSHGMYTVDTVMINIVRLSLVSVLIDSKYVRHPVA